MTLLASASPFAEGPTRAGVPELGLRATAIAHPNIALAKYWGKRPGHGNYPAVPSLSVTLEGMATVTTVTFGHPACAERGDRFFLDGVEETGEALARVTALVDRVRAASGLAEAAVVQSRNDFPTASGLASSASGFAALALAAVRAAGLDWNEAQVSDLARRSSASAGRSLFGGFVELDAGPEAPTGDEVLSARVVAPPGHIDVEVLVCVTSEGKKSVASTHGMKITASKSPYYEAWVARAPQIERALRDALLRRDLTALGEHTEASTMAMHASAFAAGVIYASGATLDVLAHVRGLRAEGHLAYATMDAGPHVKVLVPAGAADAVAASLKGVPGVLRVLRTKPGLGARILDDAARRPELGPDA